MARLDAACAGRYTPRRLALVLAVAAVLIGLQVNRSWVIGPDSALYMGLAQSLAEGGGYVFNGHPHRLVPPGYPALLAAWQTVAGNSYLGLRLLHAMLAWLCVPLAFATVRRLYGADLALAAAGLFAVAYAFIYRSGFFLSDVPFALAVWLTLYLSVRAVAAERRVWLWTAAALAALVLCPAMRINGLGVTPAVALWVLTRRDLPGRRRWTQALVLALPVLLPAAYVVVNELATPPGEVTYLRAVMADRDFLWLIHRIVTNRIGGYAVATGEAIIGVSMPDSAPWIGALLAAPAAIGWWVCLRRRDALLPLVTAVQYAGLSLSRPGERYLIFLLPALYLFVLAGIAAIAGWRGRERTEGGPSSDRVRRLRRALLAFVAVIVLVNVGRDGRAVWEARTGTPGGAQRRKYQPIFEAARWLTEHGDGVAEGRATLVTWHANELHVLTGCRTEFAGQVGASGDALPPSPTYVVLRPGDAELPGLRRRVAALGARLEQLDPPPAVAPYEIHRIVAEQ